MAIRLGIQKATAPHERGVREELEVSGLLLFGDGAKQGVILGLASGLYAEGQRVVLVKEPEAVMGLVTIRAEDCRDVMAVVSTHTHGTGIVYRGSD
jgi:hypothetical protein